MIQSGRIGAGALMRVSCAAALVAAAGCAAKSLPRVTSAPALQPALRHRVEAGETLYRIARAHGISVEALARANGIADPTAIAVGTELVIPTPDAPREIAAIAPTSEGNAQGPLPVAPERAEVSPRTPVPPRVGSLEWPLHGVLYARFGKKGSDRHDGIDLAAPLGTPVHTAKSGRVLYAGEQNGYGLVAIVDHGEGLITLYAHNRDLRVKTGQNVRESQVIATVGESGRTSGPHLHFEVRADGAPVDPLSYLPAPGEHRAVGRRLSDAR